ncbi:MAG: hypothetical protein KF837_34330 [Labilithrix sp.]|nr:hypothetical protein [Labilithrix sp.]
MNESSCPFCSAALSAELRATPPPRRLTARLSRAAVFALGTSGAAGIASLAACSDEPADTIDPSCCRDAYGGPPVNGPDGYSFDAGTDAPADADTTTDADDAD